MSGDLTLDTLQAGLRGVDQQQQMSENNIANSETPGYTAGQVSFEDQLSQAIGDGDPLSMTPTVTSTPDAALPNGNNVQITKEMNNLSQDALQQQLLTEAVNAKFRLLRTVITG
jgi:flagellar basal-body rod protein FlgB